MSTRAISANLWLQVLSTRARKDVKVADIKVQVCLYAFDCLFLNGKVLVDRPLIERREALYSAISEQPGELFYATAKVTWPSVLAMHRNCGCRGGSDCRAQKLGKRSAQLEGTRLQGGWGKGWGWGNLSL